MPAIKAVNSRNLRVENCTFSGFETDIELVDVEGFISKNNRFSRNDPRILLSQLVESIRRSKLPPMEQKQLFHEIVVSLSSGVATENSEKKRLIDKIRKYVGDKAVDYFVQLGAAVSAGLILRFI